MNEEQSNQESVSDILPTTLEEWRDRAVLLSVFLVKKERKNLAIKRSLCKEMEFNRKLQKELSLQVCISVVMFFCGLATGILCCNITDKKERYYENQAETRTTESQIIDKNSGRIETDHAEPVQVHSDEAVR